MPIIKTILIADDDEFMRLSLKTVLEKENYTVVDVANGNEAVEAFHAHLPDCILLDGLMPEKDGFSACNDIRSQAKGKAVPIFIVSGLSKEEIKTDYPGIKATGYIPKPIDWIKLIKRLDKLG